MSLGTSDPVRDCWREFCLDSMGKCHIHAEQLEFWVWVKSHGNLRRETLAQIERETTVRQTRKGVEQ
jgi:hypothetical protein